MNEVRIDKWLWATRIFKTRTIATDACKLGRVTMGGMHVKPSRLVKVGDVIAVKKPPVTYTFEVIGIVKNRVGAKQKGLGRPTKKDGREMKEFTDDAFFGFDDGFDWDDDENPLWTEEDERNLEK